MPGASKIFVIIKKGVAFIFKDSKNLKSKPYNVVLIYLFEVSYILRYQIFAVYIFNGTENNIFINLFPF